MMPDFPTAVPQIPVADLAVAVIYYRDKLGFSIDWVADDISLAGVSRDDCRLFLAGPAFRSDGAGEQRLVIWLNLRSKAEVDALFTAWQARQAMLISAPASKSWGLHEFIAADADGNQLRVFYDFATPEREATR